MGFSEIRCRKAILKTRNGGTEAAMNWLFEHMEDPGTFRSESRRNFYLNLYEDLDVPLPATVSVDATSFSLTDLSQLMDMGFSNLQAKKALKETVRYSSYLQSIVKTLFILLRKNNNVERAVDWLFSHANDVMEVGPLESVSAPGTSLCVG